MPPTQPRRPSPPPFDPWSLQPPPRPAKNSSSLGLMVVALVAVALIAWGAWSATHDGASHSDASPAPSAAASTAPLESNEPATPAVAQTPLPGPRATRETPLTVAGGEALQQLSDLEARWCEANFKGDRTALASILADEYRSVGSGPQSKDEYLRMVKRDEFVRTWSLRNLRVQSRQGDQATLSGEMIAIYPGTNRHWRFVDTFVQREGRWQATSSRTTED